jgi:LCP family protein required for cell wall assembly
VKNHKLLLLRNIIILVLSLLFLVGGGTCVYTDQLLGKINYVAPDSGTGEKTGDIFQDGNASSGTADAKAGLVGGLYHDDAVTNILLLGTDDYQSSDVGRSDSMMLISVDTRHRKLKITSFMRDMYLAIPGLGSNKLTNAYSLGGGKVKGAKKIVSTLEANFGVDIDRFAIVDFSAFPKIIDRLGGVTITLTAGEAALVNRYSGDSHKVRAGSQNLNGLQARYYSRIRDIGNDYERTLRQRKVFTSLVGKMKASSLPAIYGVLGDTLNLVTTNLQKNEIVSMASNSLTYLNYPVSQNRVPADGEFQVLGLDVGDCLVPDLDACRQSLAKFIYENDIPQGSYS